MFNGWLIKFGDVVLPNSFILADGWESVPNQRIEIDAYRDANVLLHRETSENFKTSLTLNIRSMNLAEMTAFKNVIGLATLEITSKRQRRVTVTYWNDEELDYKTAIMYMPDITYSIHTVDEAAKDIEYNSFSVELIEY
ncbi:hypothetical protein C805_00088 [Eubacterium sp. 14-2]|uniref:DUF6711 family protein n=1 Tax=Eubacterium sp. 14-2 TaxID=1235790 RepID=UPI0003369E78|nr:DUF6711 family protein [Eubacterium sp. 14-2]EOT29504.1 hypothetical protein C805_00088 [Eubacterium sp. 14-2]